MRAWNQTLLLLGLLLLLPSAMEAAVGADRLPVGTEFATAADTLRGVPYYGITLRRPGDPRGPRFGYATVAFPESPFNVAVTSRGHYVYDLSVTAERLLPKPGIVFILWIASPDLEHIRKVGVIDRQTTLETRVDFDNKFLVFVTEETSGDVSEPKGRIALRGGSRSGRMESMFAHGLCPPDTQC